LLSGLIDLEDTIDALPKKLPYPCNEAAKSSDVMQPPNEVMQHTKIKHLPYLLKEDYSVFSNDEKNGIINNYTMHMQSKRKITPWIGYNNLDQKFNSMMSCIKTDREQKLAAHPEKAEKYGSIPGIIVKAINKGCLTVDGLYTPPQTNGSVTASNDSSSSSSSSSDNSLYNEESLKKEIQGKLTDILTSRSRRIYGILPKPFV
jgi:hypothetical protein